MVKKGLILCDDYFHPGQVIIDGLDWLEFDFDIITDARRYAGIGRYDLVIVGKANNVSSIDTNPWMTEAIEREFAEYVKTGGRLLIVHSGTSRYDRNGLFRKLIGGSFVKHPEACEVTVIPACEEEPFVIFDEHYQMETDDDIHVFLTTSSSTGTEPAGWRKIIGEGKIAVLTPGHYAAVFQNVTYRSVITKTVNWLMSDKI